MYNAWLTDLSKSTVVHDKLVAFEGNIIGNTVLGKADRSYIHGNDEAEFRAAFFGKEAEEMGGSFNSVKPDDNTAPPTKTATGAVSSAQSKAPATPSRATTAKAFMATATLPPPITTTNKALRAEKQNATQVAVFFL